MLPPAFQALAASDLADQVELIKITPAAMSTDEMSKLWSAIQSHYRPSAAYQVSVVLIEGTRPARLAAAGAVARPRDPVTERDRGVVVKPDLLPPVPTLFDGETPAQADRRAPRRDGRRQRRRLAGTGHVVRLSHRLLAAPFEMPPTAVDATAPR